MFYSSKRQQYAARLGNLAMSYEERVRAAGHIKNQHDLELIRQQLPTKLFGIPNYPKNEPLK